MVDEVIFRTTDNSRWGAGKGSPLTREENDINFWVLRELIEQLANNPLQPDQIQDIRVVGNQMTIIMTDYTEFGPFTIPTIPLQFTGDFQPNHDYKKYDIVTTADSLYLVTHDFTSGDTFVLGADAGGPWYQKIFTYSTIYDIGFFFPGKPGYVGIESGQAMFTFRATRDFYLPADLPLSVAGLEVATTDYAVYLIYKNAELLGSIDIEAGQTQAQFFFDADVQFEPNDRLRIIRDTDVDATAFDLSITLRGRLGAVSS